MACKGTPYRVTCIIFNQRFEQIVIINRKPARTFPVSQIRVSHANHLRTVLSAMAPYTIMAHSFFSMCSYSVFILAGNKLASTNENRFNYPPFSLETYKHLEFTFHTRISWKDVLICQLSEYLYVSYISVTCKSRSRVQTPPIKKKERLFQPNIRFALD